MDIRPIKTEKDYKLTLKAIEELMDAEHGTPKGDRLDVLATLVAAWEEKHHAIEAPDPVAAILFIMDQRGLSRRDMEIYIGSRARVSEVLNRQRQLTLPMIRKLHSGLGIPAGVLIQSGAS